MSIGKSFGPDSLIRRSLRVAFRWARPSWEGVQGLDETAWRTQHDEISKTIWKLTTILVASCLFCVVILGAPDASLVSADAKISVPIASLTVSYGDFLLFGPLFLIGLSLYLHVFIEQLIRLRLYKSQKSASESPASSAFLFNMGRPAADLLSAFLFYGLLPCTLAFFVWKAIPRPDAPWLLSFVFIVMTGVMLALCIRRFEAAGNRLPTLRGRFGRGVLWLLFVVCLAAFFPLAWITGQIGFELLTASPDEAAKHTAASHSSLRNTVLLRIRRLQLFGAQLDKKNLNSFYAPYADLRKADFRETDLEGANLSHADLRKANLTNANLTGADLSYAHLEGAILENARLNAADLRKVMLDEFTQIGTKWRWVACVVNGDIGRECLGRPDLAWSDLSGANLRDSSLKGVQMTGVDLSYADLTGADLTGTVLRVADLRNAALPPSIKDAVIDGALMTARPGVSRTETEAIIYLTNRASEACLQAPEQAENFSHPTMSYPCGQGIDSGYGWHVKRLPNATFVLRSTARGTGGRSACLDGTSESYDYSPIQMWECNDDYENQHWHITPVVGGYVLIEKENSGFCLQGPENRDNSPVPLLAKCNHEDHNQHWTISMPGAGSATQSSDAVQRKRALDLQKAAHQYRVSPSGFVLEYHQPHGRPFYGFGSSYYYRYYRPFPSSYRSRLGR
jgi:uncharacterized protein YjbI with pentapeptide repeats